MRVYTREDIVDASGDENLLFADGFDAAIMGYVQIFNNTVVLYNFDKVIEILINDEGLTEEEALEHYYFNIAGSYVGESTPAFAFTNLF